MKTKVKLLSKDSGEVEFVATKKKKEDGISKLVLKTSKGGSWSEDYTNTKLVEIEDDGNGIFIEFGSCMRPNDKRCFSIDYADFETLYLAMREHILTEPNLMPEYERLINVKDCVRD